MKHMQAISVLRSSKPLKQSQYEVPTVNCSSRLFVNTIIPRVVLGSISAERRCSRRKDLSADSSRPCRTSCQGLGGARAMRGIKKSGHTHCSANGMRNAHSSGRPCKPRRTPAEMSCPMMKHMLVKLVKYTLRIIGRHSEAYAGAVVAKTPQGKPARIWPTHRTTMLGEKNVMNMKAERRTREVSRTLL